LIGFPRNRALGIQFGYSHDISRRVQIALRVTADQLKILREGDIAFDDSRSLDRCSFVTLQRVFRELQARTTMTDRKIGHREFRNFLGAFLCVERNNSQRVEQSRVSSRSSASRPEHIELLSTSFTYEGCLSVLHLSFDRSASMVLDLTAQGSPQELSPLGKPL